MQAHGNVRQENENNKVHWLTLALQIKNKYSKVCVKRQLKIDKTMVLMTTESLMKVESIAECSPWSILQYIWPALKLHNL